jgi:hypothetical protein
MASALDGAGQIKMQVLENALLQLQRISGLVEQYALAVKRNQPSTVFVMNLRRQLPALGENLKAQFGMVSDVVLNVSLASSRGASEAMRVRQLREGVAHIRQALEIAAAQTVAKHALKEKKGDPDGGPEKA